MHESSTQSRPMYWAVRANCATVALTSGRLGDVAKFYRVADSGSQRVFSVFARAEALLDSQPNPSCFDLVVCNADGVTCE